MKILLLEDNVKLNATIKKRLELKGYQLDTFLDGKEAYNAIHNGYSCFVLDINVPNIDGVKILKKIRENNSDIPVIIISASVELELIKEAYDFGCNDYLKKPFFIDELEIKIQKLCIIQDERIKYDTHSYFDFKSSVLYIKEEEIRLTKKERLLLNLFLSKKNKVLSFESIEAYVWEGSFVSLESIRTLIRRLRKILVHDYIETIVDTGYIFRVPK